MSCARGSREAGGGGAGGCSCWKAAREAVLSVLFFGRYKDAVLKKAHSRKHVEKRRKGGVLKGGRGGRRSC